jgi:hypothetical protein
MYSATRCVDWNGEALGVECLKANGLLQVDRATRLGLSSWLSCLCTASLHSPD